MWAANEWPGSHAATAAVPVVCSIIALIVAD
jgi:hypothetical protein